jgi:hypothetical protein
MIRELWSKSGSPLAGVGPSSPDPGRRAAVADAAGVLGRGLVGDATIGFALAVGTNATTGAGVVVAGGATVATMLALGVGAGGGRSAGNGALDETAPAGAEVEVIRAIATTTVTNTKRPPTAPRRMPARPRKTSRRTGGVLSTTTADGVGAPCEAERALPFEKRDSSVRSTAGAAGEDRTGVGITRGSSSAKLPCGMGSVAGSGVRRGNG